MFCNHRPARLYWGMSSHVVIPLSLWLQNSGELFIGRFAPLSNVKAKTRKVENYS